MIKECLLIILSCSYFFYAEAVCLDNSTPPERQINELSKIIDKIEINLNRCEYSSLGKKPKHLIYLFEGRNGFSKDLLSSFKKFQALKPVCLKDASGNFIYKFPDGSWIYANSLKAKLDKIVNPETSGTAVGLKNFIVEGFCLSGRSFEDTEVVLFGENEELKHSLECIQKHYWNRYDGKNTPSLLIMGYSRGGARAIEFANSMSSYGISVNSAITVDPVPKNFFQTAEKIIPAVIGVSLPSNNPSSFSVPENIAWANFWQETDNRWGEASNAGLHGSPVKSADINEKIEMPHLTGRSNGGHWKIFEHEKVRSAIVKKLIDQINNK